MNPAARQNLESALYGGTMEHRLDALRQLCATLHNRACVGTNTHIHTNESFSVFRSPAEAVWQAAREGLAVFGINDHYTVAGHEEFRRACQVAGVPATFSMEAVAMDRQAEASSTLMNDPDNPGRVYLCAKGITHLPPDSSPAIRKLSKMRLALQKRNQQMTERVGELFRTRLDIKGPDWQEVVGLTPRSNVTERHIARAILFRLCTYATSKGISLSDAVGGCCQTVPPAGDDASLQDFIRTKLLKTGGPCYVEESPQAFVSVEEMRNIFLAFGSIPTYPILGNPVTGGERDIDALLTHLEAVSIFAVEVIPWRNTRERLVEIVGAAKARYWPLFNGSEHNCPVPRPLLDPLSLDPDFAPWFERSSAVLLGHQELVKQGQPGFLNEDGLPSIEDPHIRFKYFERAGRPLWPR